MTTAESRCFEYARHMAEMSNFPRARVGCVVAYKGNVLAAGWNSNKTHPVQAHYNQYRKLRTSDAPSPAQLHAETAALVQLRNEDVPWDKVDVFVYRLRRDRPHGMVRPCAACQRYMRDLGIKSIWYTGDDSYIHEVITDANT